MENYLIIGLFSIQALIIVFLVMCVLKFNNRQYKQLSDLLSASHQYNLTINELNKLTHSPVIDNTPPRTFPSRATDADEADIEELRNRV